MLATMSTVLHNIFGIRICEEVSSKIVNTVKLAEFIYSNGSLNESPLKVAITKKGQEHSIKIHNNWKYVRKELEEYTLDNLAPFEELKFRHQTID